MSESNFKSRLWKSYSGLIIAVEVIHNNKHHELVQDLGKGPFKLSDIRYAKNHLKSVILNRLKNQG